MRTRLSGGKTRRAANWRVAMAALLAVVWMGVSSAAGPIGQEGLPAAPPPGRLVEQPEEPLVYFRRSGGFAGALDEAWVDRDGVYSTASGKGQLDSAEKSRLVKLIDAVVHTRDPLPTAPAPCADCVYYDLALYTAEGTRTIRVADIQLGDGPLRELVTLLESVLVEKEAG